jgi:hypothetical protein
VHLLSRVLLLTALVGLTCCATGPKTATPTGLKPGAYFVVVDGAEHILTLTPDKNFQYLFSRSNYEDGKPRFLERHGTYSIEGSDLWFEYELADGSHQRADGPMWIVWWGQRCYLVMPSERSRFNTFAITHRWPKENGGNKLPRDVWEPRKTKEGFVYLHDGDWLLPVKGKPGIPPKP